MPVVLLLLLPLLLIFVVVLSLVLLPISLVQRYRIGIARRPGPYVPHISKTISGQFL